MFFMFNGAVCPITSPQIQVLDRGWALADGCFETMRFVQGSLIWPAQHLARLHAGLQLLQIPYELGLPQLEQWLTHLCELNQLQHGIARLQVSRGVQTQRGFVMSEQAQPTVSLIIAPALWPQTPRQFEVVIAQTTRRNEFSPLTRFKALGSYGDQLQAALEAQAAAVQDALLLNTQGQLACSTTANLWLIRGREVWTPPVSVGALPGTVRAYLLATLPTNGFHVHEQSFTPSELAQSDEVWLTNIGMGIGWIKTIKGARSFDHAPFAEQVHRQLSNELGLV